MNYDEILIGESTKITVGFKRKLYLMNKRFVDILCSIIGMPFLLIFIFIIKLISICTGDFSPIIFKHTRIGKNGVKFKMYKFRTMVPNAPDLLKSLLENNEELRKEWEENHKLDNDPRITKIGKILRKTSIDELPQIINILNGDMTIIGPRPLVDDEVEKYGKNKSKLLSMRPGLTGYWAVNGRSCTTYEKRMELELFYIDNSSLKLDIKIFFMTIIKVLKREGAK